MFIFLVAATEALQLLQDAEALGWESNVLAEE